MGVFLLVALQKTPSLLGAECRGVGTTPLHANERGQKFTGGYLLNYKNRKLTEKKMTVYSEQDKHDMEVAFDARNASRLQELIDFCKISGFKKIGVANCKGVQEYADKFVKKLQEAGFEVFAINCKKKVV